MWNLDQAISTVKKIEEILSPVGFHAGLTGSVLIKDKSDKDIDVIVYPHCSGNSDITQAYKALRDAGFTRKVSRAKVAHFWEKAGSKDSKHVEVWNTEDDKRIDIFFLR